MSDMNDAGRSGLIEAAFQSTFGAHQPEPGITAGQIVNALTNAGMAAEAVSRQARPGSPAMTCAPFRAIAALLDEHPESSVAQAVVRALAAGLESR